MKSKPTRYVPDGGWGWMVVLGVALTNAFNQSLVSLFGLLFSEHLERLGKGTVGVALVMNLNSVSLNLSGLVTGPIIKNLTTRQVTLIGTILTGSGLILSSQSEAYWQVVVSYGIIFGFGLGLISSSTFITVNSYFNLRRGQAVGYSLAGTGVGQMLMPYVVKVLLENYNFRGTTLILGALALHGLVGACLDQPVEWHMKSNVDERKSLLPIELDTDTEKEDSTTSEETIFDAQRQNGNVLKDEIHFVILPSPVKESFFTRMTSAMDLKLLKDPTYLSITFGLAMAYTASINFSMIFPYFLQKTIELNLTDTALCMSILASTDLLSRLTLPLITDKWRISSRITFLVGATGLIFVRTVLALSTDRTALLVISGVYGYIRAATVVNQSLCISEYCGQERLAGGLGLNMCIKAIFVITVGLLLGWIRDYTLSYSICLHAQNVLLIIVVCCWTIELMYKKYYKR